MSSQLSSEHKLLLIVGSNPLPNYLSAYALRPSEITLVYTKETESAKKRLKQELKKALGETITVGDQFVEDSTCATTVARAIKPLIGTTTHLNYTGGTKVMAAHARLIFQDAGGRPEYASYLDEGGVKRTPRLRFDDGNSHPLAEYNVPLTLQTVLALHGITYKPREAKQPAPTTDDAHEILCKVLAEPSLASRLYKESSQLKAFNKPDDATAQSFHANDYGLTLSLPVFPTSEQLSLCQNSEAKKSWFKQWYKFIGGEWLEEWLGEQIRALNLAPTPEITVGVNAKRGEQNAELEVDVVVIRGHRTYFISCTTDTSKDICKSKLFEVAVRSRQLGGDLVRAALVCLANNEITAKLQADIDDVWVASNTTKVFGIDDIRTWSDCDKRPNQHSLKTWLES